MAEDGTSSVMFTLYADDEVMSGIDLDTIDLGGVIDSGWAVRGPEAVDGGPIAFIRDGDPITLDVTARTLEVDMPDLEARKEGWTPNPPKYTRGVLGKYAKVVQSAAHGAITS